MHINILTPGFSSPNGRAFLFPILRHQEALKESGITCTFLSDVVAGVSDCDLLMVDSKFHKPQWQSDRQGVLDQFAGWAERGKVMYCDTGDSSSWLQADLLNIVHVYAKSQLLVDRTRYCQPIYAHRLYADHYHQRFDIADAEPEWSAPVQTPQSLSKLRVLWNSGLAAYSLFGPLRMGLYEKLPLRALLQYSRPIAAPNRKRPIDVSCRFGVSYARASVAAQRQLICKFIGHRQDVRKLSRRAYFEELKNSKVVVSPFGLGEITLKDFEVFLTGGLLLKPDMAHMETWPRFFQPGATMLTHNWDLTDFNAVLDDAVKNYDAYVSIAEAGQDTYRQHTSGDRAAELFCSHFDALTSHISMSAAA